MEKRFQSIDNTIIVSVVVPISVNEQEKLESKDYSKQIEDLAKEFDVDWAIETSEGQQSTALISRTFGAVTDSNEVHQLDVDATNFMSAIDKLEFNKHDQDYEFIKEIVDEWDETETRAQTSGFLVMARTRKGMSMPCGTIREKLAKELCLSYLKVHCND